MQTRLNVPFLEKEQAKSLGARWDPARKWWYCPDGVDLRLFKKWLPEDVSRWLGALPPEDEKRIKRAAKKARRKARRRAQSRQRWEGARTGSMPRDELTPEQRDHLRSI